MSTLPFITIVMPVRNEASFIADTLGQLLAQDYPHDRMEIIVADGFSDDDTRTIVANLAISHSCIRLIDNPRRLSSAGRNEGFRNGSGDIFLVVDGHCFIPDQNLLKNVVHCFEESGADCLGRPQPLDPPGLTCFQQAVAMARQSRLGHGGDSLIYSDYEGYCSPVSNGAAYRREVFERVGFVDENFDAAEDVEFNYQVEKAGLTCYTSPRLTVRYYPRESLKSLFRQMQRYGKGRYRFIRKHSEALTFNQLIPPLFVGGMFLLALFGLLSLAVSDRMVSLKVAFGTLILAYLFYAAMVVAESIRIAVRHGSRYLATLPMVFLAIHAGLGWGFLTEATQIRGK